MWTPCLVSSTTASGEVTVRVGHELVDDYLHTNGGAGSVLDKARWLEYVQRLTHRRRNVLSDPDVPQLAQAIRGFPQQHVPRAWLAKGNYFTLSGRSPFQRRRHMLAKVLTMTLRT